MGQDDDLKSAKSAETPAESGAEQGAAPAGKGVAALMSSRQSAPPPAPPAPEAAKRRKPPVKAATAYEMAARQRDISVAEFFQKNRHLLGFDNPRKALLTTVKEAVDNSLDACEEAGILPDLHVLIDQLAEERF